MWSTDTWRESEDEVIAENHASAGTSEGQANTSSAKRQRRPNVRLEELRDQHASPLADKRKKKTGMCTRPSTGDSRAHSKENLPWSSFVPNSLKTGKALNTGVCVSNGELYKQSSVNVGDDGQRADSVLPCCINGPAEPCPDFEKANKLQQILKITGEKGRNRGRKHGRPKLGASVKKLPCAPRSIRAHCEQKVPCMQDAKDMDFDKENNTQSPAIFEASGYQDVISPFERRERSDMVLLHSHQNFQPGDYLPARAQVRGERSNQWIQSSKRMQAFKLIDNADGKHMVHANVSLHVPKGKLVVKGNGPMHGARSKLVAEANGNGDSREPSKKNAVRRCSRPWLEVGEWLQDLGLGKYAQIFENHEVEPEVLPLLTLDDLREMGVSAVGSRRKIFSAIQHIRKALLAESD